MLRSLASQLIDHVDVKISDLKREISSGRTACALQACKLVHASPVHHLSSARALFHACGSAGHALVSSCDSACSPGKTLHSDQSGTENDFGSMETLLIYDSFTTHLSKKNCAGSDLLSCSKSNILKCKVQLSSARTEMGNSSR